MNTNTQSTPKPAQVGHTPGPWTYDGMWSLIMAGKYEIAAIHCARTIEDTRKRKRIDETQANARLIAAAPDLLNACKAICRELEYAFGGHSQMPEMEAKFYEQAQTAISRAEGRL